MKRNFFLSPDLIRGIKDPEKIETLEELNVVTEEGVQVKRFNNDCFLITVEFIPTVPHCTLASLIGKSTLDFIYLLFFFF